MASITTLRPSAVSSGVGWSALPAGTLDGVTSDDSDLTYAQWGGSGSPLILQTPVDSPPVGERRHLVRLRARGEDGSAWWAVRLATGGLVAGASATFGASPETISGSWATGAPADGPTILSAYVTAQSPVVKITELYLDMDSREAPTFTAEVLDGTGASTVVVSDTATPTLRAASIDLDDLAARQYRFWITLNGATVWDTGIVSGAAIDRQITPLENGSYVANLQIWSTLGANTAYASDIEQVAFELAVGEVPAPAAPDVTPEEPFYRVEFCAPDMTGFDDETGHIEVQRVDCPMGGYLLLTGSAGGYAGAEPAAGTLTDLEVTAYAQRSDGWRPVTDETLVAQWDTAGNQRGFILGLNADGGGDPALGGRPYLAWSNDGTATVVASATDRAPIDPFGRVNLRAYLDVNDGAGGWSVEFETLDADGTWVRLGDLVTNGGAGTTAVFASSAEITVGAHLAAGVPAELFVGRVYSAQVRDGRAGTIIAGPDFMIHPTGTEAFLDAYGAEWTIRPPAALTSSQVITTIAMVGPLESAECAEWVDFTLPRTGVALTCDHQPEPCCSYYRVRTVGRIDGVLVVSDWSDAYNPGVPEGIIFAWPGTAATLPFGWQRVTELDGKYPKGVPNGSTDPGATGGSATHAHTTPGHVHSLDHLHTTSANTGASANNVSAPNTAGALKYLSSHTHTRPSTASQSVNSGNTAPGSDTEPNDPSNLTVIWAESNGNPFGVPEGALALMLDIAPSGWSTYTDATGRFLKGAAAAGNGGATSAGSLATHGHAVDAHVHGTTNHNHTSANTGSTGATLAPAAGANVLTSAATHNHPIAVSSSTTAALASTAGGASGTTTPAEPPFRNLRVRKNDTGGNDLPVGVIGLWRGELAEIPDSWQLCDGTNSTPDMSARYPKGATASINGSGGALSTHTHTSPSTHGHTTSGHTHTSQVQASAAASAGTSATAGVVQSLATHTHTMTDTDTATPTVGTTAAGALDAIGVEPPYEEVAFIQLMETPEPPPFPETFCLIYSDDYHLIRTTGPNGPLWAPVAGKFDWEVERPFTAATGVMGTRFVTSAPPGGRNLRLVAAVESEAELATLHAVIARPLVLISPSDATEVWAAPVAESVKIVKVGRIRQVSVDFIATGPQPPPQLADVGA